MSEGARGTESLEYSLQTEEEQPVRALASHECQLEA